MKSFCDNCGFMFDSDFNKCPNCEADLSSYEESNIPKREFYVFHKKPQITLTLVIILLILILLTSIFFISSYLLDLGTGTPSEIYMENSKQITILSLFELPGLLVVLSLLYSVDNKKYYYYSSFAFLFLLIPLVHPSSD